LTFAKGECFPSVGDEGIYTEIPNPEAGHEKEVIPPPDTPGDSSIEPRF